MSVLIHPIQQPSREILKAASDLCTAICAQFAHVGPIIAPGFAIQIYVPGVPQPVFSLTGDLRTPGAILPGNTIPFPAPKKGG